VNSPRTKNYSRDASLRKKIDENNISHKLISNCIFLSIANLINFIINHRVYYIIRLNNNNNNNNNIFQEQGPLSYIYIYIYIYIYYVFSTCKFLYLFHTTTFVFNTCIVLVLAKFILIKIDLCNVEHMF